MTIPLVSVVVAAYCTRCDQFAVAINSARAQTHRDLEILICDDSPDDCLRQIVEEWHDDRLRYTHQAPSLGVAVNHWNAFTRARGEYIVVLNHDDWLAPEFVETMVAALRQHPEAVLAFCDHWIMDLNGHRQLEDTERNTARWGRAGLAAGLHRPFSHLLAAQAIPMAMGTMFRRSALPKALPVHAGPAYDLWLTYLLSRTGGGACYVPERLSAWRSHSENQTSQAGLSWLQGAADCWQAVADDSKFAEIRLAARGNAAGAYGACAVRSWRDGQPLACARFALRSLVAHATLRGLGLLLLPFLPRWLGASVGARHSAR
jgi:glycosyltransferase involved in cell wall biosynthesis